MKKRKHDTRWMVSVALMAAIVVVLANTPLGMIQLPIIKATTVHIPVIIGANIFTIADAFKEPFDPSLILPYLIGILVAAGSGIAAISMVRYISTRKTYRPFVFYTLGAGLLTIVLSLILK